MPRRSRAIPTPPFIFFGHSNGTYCLAKALALYTCCRFSRVAFAGSVVPQSFDWKKYAGLGQVHQVLNFTATTDWVVAGFPRLFEWLRLSDLGSAGHNGFCNKEKDTRWVANRGYARGGHGAATAEEWWDYIAEFLYPGQDATARPEPLPPLAEDRNWAVCLLSTLPIAAWAIAFCLALGGGYAIGRLAYTLIVDSVLWLAMVRERLPTSVADAAGVVTELLSVGVVAPILGGIDALLNYLPFPLTPAVGVPHSLEVVAATLATLVGAAAVWTVITKL
jgi:hypothetical protein